MHTNLIFEWNVAREKQQDWLRQAAQERMIRSAKSVPGSSAKVDRQAPGNLRMWLVRRRATS